MDKCIICLESSEDTQKYFDCKCKEVRFHETCFTDYIKTNRTCPICKIYYDDDIKLYKQRVFIIIFLCTILRLFIFSFLCITEIQNPHIIIIQYLLILDTYAMLWLFPFFDGIENIRQNGIIYKEYCIFILNLLFKYFIFLLLAVYVKNDIIKYIELIWFTAYHVFILSLTVRFRA